MDALDLAKTRVLDGSDIKSDVQTEQDGGLSLIVMFKTTDGSNLLTVENIKYIYDVTSKFENNDPNKYDQICIKNKDDNWPNCAGNAIWNPLSDYYESTNGVFTEQDLLDELNSKSNAYGEAYWNCFEDGFVDSLESSYYRGFWRFGLPYPDINRTESSYFNKNDKQEEQRQYYIDYVFPIYESIQTKDYSKSNIEVVIYGSQVRSDSMDAAILAGVMFSIYSIITVIILMWLHLQSLFLAVSSLFQILLGFPFAYFVYRWIAQITFFDTMSTLVIFLILGIGADDVFVFVDAWRQSPTFVGDDLVDRMSFTYRRASKAMIITTATTFFAFMATSLSPIIPISAFGWWAGFVVLMNYVMVITLFPAILSFWYQHVKEKEKLCCCCKRFQKDKDSVSDDNNSKDNSKDNILTSDDPMTALKNGEARCVERFFRDHWFMVINKLKYVFIVISLGLIGVAAWKASEIGPLTQQEEFFPKNV